MSDPVKSDKVCVVVGVGEGLGAALAVRFAAGYKVALIARSSEVIQKTAGEIKSAGGVALSIQSDATIEAQIADAYDRIKRELDSQDVREDLAAARIAKSGSYLMGDQLSVADILLMTCLDWAVTDRIPLSDTLHAYRSRVAKRPAYHKALERNFPARG